MGDKGKKDPFQGYEFDQIGFSNLFKKLDVNEDGHIDIEELHDGLHRLGIHRVPGQAEQIMKIGDKNKNDLLSFDEFLKYCYEHERKLWIVFKSIDNNNSDTVTAEELQLAFEKLGSPLTQREVEILLKKMDKEGNLQIDWNEWREFHLLNPHAHNLNEIRKFWKHATFIDIGDDMMIPDDFDDEEKKTGMVWKQLTAGGMAGVISRTCTAPLDRLKVLLQVHAGNDKNNWTLKRGFQKMLSEGGTRSLWRGNFVNCVKIAPESAIKFFAYENMKRVLAGRGKFDKNRIGIRERFIAGSAAGICSQFSIYPMEVLKTRLALGKTGEYRHMLDCAQKVYQKDGIRVFYRGLAPGLIGVIPYAGIDLCVYETLKVHWLSHHTEKTDPGVFILLLCGTISSTCGQIASYPLALVRTKLQAQTNDPSFRGIRAKGSIDMFKIIFRQNGVRGLYRGILPNFLKVAPAVSISYVVYEKTRKLLGMT